ncbi:MAG: hypothetical protein ACI4KJ_03005 [Anaerovoracaceae bacterium]
MAASARRYGIVDIGSNTVHAVIYDVSPDGSYSKLMNRKDSAQLINYIEKNRMKKSGIERLRSLVVEFEGIFDLLGCDETDYFATSSLRHLENGASVVEQIFAQSGVSIRILDGKKEAEYDFLAFAGNTEEEDFVGADIGGGSMQLVRGSGGSLRDCACLECGCLRMYRRFVRGILPTELECERITGYISGLCDAVLDTEAFETDTLYFIGGTARAASKYLRKAEDMAGSTRKYYFTLSDLRRIRDSLVSGRSDTVSTVLGLFPERICTFVPGLIAMITICEKVGAGRICVLKDGVREGVMAEKLSTRKN